MIAGVVIDHTSHDIDLMRYLIDEPITKVYGETLQSINWTAKNFFDGLLRFKGGAVGVLDELDDTHEDPAPGRPGRAASSSATCSQELFYENDSAPSQWDALSVLRGVTEGNMLGIRLTASHEPLAAEINDFVSAVREGRKLPVTGEDGLETLRPRAQIRAVGRRRQTHRSKVDGKRRHEVRHHRRHASGVHPNLARHPRDSPSPHRDLRQHRSTLRRRDVAGVLSVSSDIPKPDLDLEVGTQGASHAVQTGQIMMKLEPLLLSEKPDFVIVYGRHQLDHRRRRSPQRS